MKLTESLRRKSQRSPVSKQIFLPDYDILKTLREPHPDIGQIFSWLHKNRLFGNGMSLWMVRTIFQFVPPSQEKIIDEVLKLKTDLPPENYRSLPTEAIGLHSALVSNAEFITGFNPITVHVNNRMELGQRLYADLVTHPSTSLILAAVLRTHLCAPLEASLSKGEAALNRINNDIFSSILALPIQIDRVSISYQQLVRAGESLLLAVKKEQDRRGQKLAKLVPTFEIFSTSNSRKLDYRKRILRLEKTNNSMAIGVDATG